MSDKNEVEMTEEQEELLEEIEDTENLAVAEEAPPFRKVIWNEIRNDKLALVSLFLFIIIMAFVFVAANFVDAGDARKVNFRTRDLAPGEIVGDKKYVLGTDPAGRDMVEQLILGSRNSLVIALAVTLIVGVVGIAVGLISGFYGGMVDNIIMRIVDFLSMLPQMMMVIVFVTLTPNYTVGFFIIIMSVLGWVSKARLIRSRTLQEGNMEYVAASKTLGTHNPVIILREVLPNLASIIVVDMTLTLARNVGLETGLTFLGFGLPFGTASLGTLLGYAKVPETMRTRPWQWLPAALLTLVLMLCINFVGQAINRAADAKQRT